MNIQNSLFRSRGNDMTRLETFTDAAFAFALTMLVISKGTIPANYEELILALKGIPSFAFSFASILWFWIGHRKWSRWFGLEDNISILLTLILIFTMLVYVFPLRLIFSAFWAWVTGGFLPTEFTITEVGELINLFVIYGMGFFALAGSLALLFYHALKSKKVELSDTEKLKTKLEFATWGSAALIGMISALFAIVFPPRIAVYAGFVYMLLALTMPTITIYYEKKIEKTVSKS